jgi:uncharacterized protein (UPF0332 family)
MDKKKRVQHWTKRAQQAARDALALIQKGGSPEGIINRSYYAVLHAILALLRSIDDETSEHGAAMALFKKEFLKTAKLPDALGATVDEIAKLFQASESEDGQAITSEQAFEAHNATVEFVAAVEEYLTAKP